MGSISIILRRPPYGTVDAAEAIRHALGGITEDMAVRLLLVDGGVHAARKGQEVEDTEYQSIENGISDCIEMGVEVVVDKGSMREGGLEAEELIEGVNIANSYEIAEIVKESDTVMIF
jgi:sulfur relay (sulfurtransferase) DsrF/TusC family protein